MDNVVYLEKFVESTANMPAELNRLLRTIKELDIKSEELAAQIQENFEAVMAKSPGKGDAAEVAAMRKRIEDDQALLIQWAEEKVQLALMGHDLLEMHQEVLAQDQSALYHELTEMGLMQDDAYGVDDGYGLELQVPEPTGRRGGASRLQYAGSFDSLEPAALELRPAPSRKTTIPLSMSRQQSGYVSEGGYGTGSEMLNWDAPKRNANNRRSGAGAGDAAYGSRRRAASAAVHATAAAVAALDEDEGYGAGDPSPGGELEALPFTALEPFVPGLVESSKEPQARGRPLTLNDIGPHLVGRVAEVYWPDEHNPENSLWYLVKIQSVNVADQTASIRYQNGEEEAALSLAEVAKEAHMLLIDTR